MTDSLSDDLLELLRNDGLDAIAERLGTDRAQADAGVSAALPLLFGALARDVRREGESVALFDALHTHYRGVDPGNALGTALHGGAGGDAILRRVIGRREGAAAQTLGAIDGLGAERAALLLQALAPVVLAFLARRLFANGDDIATRDESALRSMLDDEAEAMEARNGFGGGLATVLDDDADGTSLSDFTTDQSALGVQTAEMRSPRPLL